MCGKLGEHTAAGAGVPGRNRRSADAGDGVGDPVPRLVHGRGKGNGQLFFFFLKPPVGHPKERPLLL